MTTIHLDLWGKQIEALEAETPADAAPEDGVECLFGGATRGGKSHLARVLLITYCLSIPNLQCLLIRKKQQDILDNHVFGPNGFKDMLGPLIATGQAIVTQDNVSFANGSRITFKHCQDERQFDTAQGITSHVLVLDEATQISQRLLRTFRGWCTMTVEMKAALPDYFKHKLPRLLYTANPVGPSVPYFRRHFVKARPSGTMEKVGAFHRVYIPSKVEDNPSENAAATRGRMMEIGDAAIAQAMLEGDWDAPVGEFFPEYTDDRHCTPDFQPPSHWYTYGTYDWGGRFDPACAYWWAVSDGESFIDNRNQSRWFPRDAIVCYRELYFCDPEDPSKGAGLRNEEMRDRIYQACLTDGERRNVFLTDSFPHADRGGPTIAEVFRSGPNPITLKLGDTNRPVGWSLLRGRLIGKCLDLDRPPTPMIYFTQSCTFMRDYLPTLPRHKTKTNDATDSGEATHAADCARYACASRPRTYDSPVTIQSERPALPKNTYTFNYALESVKKNKGRRNAY